MQEALRHFSYEGWDIVPSLIEEAKNKFGDNREALFRIKEVFSQTGEEEEKFDWVVA